jgi:hypothetical protein
MFRAFLGMFAQVGRAAITFVLPVRVDHLGSCWINFHEIIYLEVPLTSAHKIQVWLKLDKKDRHFTCTPTYMYNYLAYYYYHDCLCYQVASVCMFFMWGIPLWWIYTGWIIIVSLVNWLWLIIYFYNICDWDLNHIHGWCKIILCNIHNNFFSIFLGWWWLLVDSEHVALKPCIVQEECSCDWQLLFTLFMWLLGFPSMFAVVTNVTIDVRVATITLFIKVTNVPMVTFAIMVARMPGFISCYGYVYVPDMFCLAHISYLVWDSVFFHS